MRQHCQGQGCTSGGGGRLCTAHGGPQKCQRSSGINTHMVHQCPMRGGEEVLPLGKFSFGWEGASKITLSGVPPTNQTKRSSNKMFSSAMRCGQSKFWFQGVPRFPRSGFSRPGGQTPPPGVLWAGMLKPNAHMHGGP